MKQICKNEIFKLFHCKEPYILLCLMLLAFGLPIGFMLSPSSYSFNYAFGDGRLPSTAYMVLGYAFWSTLGIFVLLFSMLSVTLTNREIENHYFYLYFPRVRERNKIYTSKYLVLIIFAIIWYLVYTLLFNPLGHFIMCHVRPDMAVKIMSDGSVVYWFCMWLMNLAELLFYISLVNFLATKLKPLATITVTMVVYYISIFIHDFPIVKFFVPECYKQVAISCNTSSDSTGILLFFTAVYIVIILVYSILFFLKGKKQFEKISA